MKQLVLFQGEPVPESRAKALVKIEKEHGKDAALKRRETYATGQKMREVIADKTEGDPKWAIVTRTRQINKAVGIEGVNKCDPADWPFVGIGHDLIISVYKKDQMQSDRKADVVSKMSWLGKMVSEFKELTGAKRELQTV